MARLLNVGTIRRGRVSLYGVYIVVVMVFLLSLESMQSLRRMNERDVNDTWINSLMTEFDASKTENQHPSVVLFTTFKNQPDRLFLQYNTIRNWASLRPFVQPVLFTTSRRGDGTDLLEKIARDSGWHLYPAPSISRHGLPFIRPMFEMIESTYRGVVFRGYANGDLLFDASLTKNIQAIATHTFHMKRSVLVGNCTAYGGSFINEKNSLNKEQLRANMAKTASKANGAKGYVIIGGFYPWEKFPELVIGRDGFIDVIVNLAVAHDAEIIDTTSSLLAVHRPVKSGPGSQSTGKDADFNVNAVVNAYGLAKNSMINMMPVHYETTADFLGNIHIIRTPPKPVVKVKIAVKKKETKKLKAKSEKHDATGQGKKREVKDTQSTHSRKNRLLLLLAIISHFTKSGCIKYSLMVA